MQSAWLHERDAGYPPSRRACTDPIIAYCGRLTRRARLTTAAAVPITKNRLLYNCYRLKLCSEHLLADTVTDSEGRDTRFCRKCHRLQAVSEFEVRASWTYGL